MQKRSLRLLLTIFTLNALVFSHGYGMEAVTGFMTMFGDFAIDETNKEEEIICRNLELCDDYNDFLKKKLHEIIDCFNLEKERIPNIKFYKLNRYKTAIQWTVKESKKKKNSSNTKKENADIKADILEFLNHIPTTASLFYKRQLIERHLDEDYDKLNTEPDIRSEVSEMFKNIKTFLSNNKPAKARKFLMSGSKIAYVIMETMYKVQQTRDQLEKSLEKIRQN